ncbi:MAG: response regulator, partial [Nitrospiraceae bacterium]|nr:response regulator [Nitrospiraceae bacterium]
VRIECEQVTVGANDYLPLEEGPYVRISIRDEGPGIPEDTIHDIFDPYFTTKETGSGLGLSTCYSIIKKHGGHIAVKSDSGAGTAFQVYLPAARRASVPESEGEEGIVRLRCKVLVTDDEEIVRMIAGEMLGYFGCEVDYAVDGAEAIERYRDAMVAGRPYDLVMLDLTIPGGMGGREAIGKLREMDPQIKAIVVSGYSNDPVMSQYQSFGFKGVVTKPYRMNELNREVRRVYFENGSPTV